MSIETAASLRGARDDRGVDLAAGRKPRSLDAVASRDSRAGAEWDYDRWLWRLAWRLGVLGSGGLGRRRGGRFGDRGIELCEEPVGGCERRESSRMLWCKARQSL
jgi:hypothetical protein